MLKENVIWDAVTYIENTKRKPVAAFSHRVAGNSDRGASVVAERTGQARRVGGNQGSDKVHQFEVETYLTSKSALSRATNRFMKELLSRISNQW